MPAKSLSTKDFGTLLSIMPHWPQGNSRYAGETSKGDDSKICYEGGGEDRGKIKIFTVEDKILPRNRLVGVYLRRM